VCKADKGGALLILDPVIVREMMESKLHDNQLFDSFDSDPLPGIMFSLRTLWLEAVVYDLIPFDMARDTVGITESMLNSEDGRPSTLDIFKPGVPSFSALPKIHKLSIEELVPGVPLPFRMVTDLSRGPTCRADKFIAANFLKDLQDDYCKDLIQDSTMFLQKLDVISPTSDHNFLFNVDVESLYDSLRRTDVDRALREAISIHRPNWSSGLVEWILESVNLSLDSSVARFGGVWFRAKDGVATGGKLCVYLANITVYYALNMIIYSRQTSLLIFLIRFVDDGIGGWKGDIISFYRWFKRVYDELNKEFNLRLTFNIVPCFQFIEFLDVSFRFVNGVLETDMFYKPTDAHRYLNFNSRHPPHVFRGVVFSQFLRVRRIVIDQSLLEYRLNEMMGFFIDSDYPRVLVEEVLYKVLYMDRRLDYKVKADDLSGRFEIPWVVTFGPGYREVKRFVQVTNQTLSQSLLFQHLTCPVLGVVTRRASNLKDMLFNQKGIFINNIVRNLGPVTTHRCTPVGVIKKGHCMCCYLMSNQSEIVINEITMTCEGGDCKSKNVVYGITCNRCNMGYIGKTTQALSARISKHRCQISSIDASTELSDENTLAAHALNDHGIQTRDGFDDLYAVYIIKVLDFDPSSLTFKEQELINFFKTYHPYGLNRSRPIGLGPVLRF